MSVFAHARHMERTHPMSVFAHAQRPTTCHALHAVHQACVNRLLPAHNTCVRALPILVNTCMSMNMTCNTTTQATHPPTTHTSCADSRASSFAWRSCCQPWCSQLRAAETGHASNTDCKRTLSSLSFFFRNSSCLASHSWRKKASRRIAAARACFCASRSFFSWLLLAVVVTPPAPTPHPPQLCACSHHRYGVGCGTHRELWQPAHVATDRQ